MKRFLFFVGCLFSTLTMASNWQLAYFFDGGDSMFFDKDSIVRTSANRIQVWTAIVFFKDAPLSVRPYGFNLVLTLKEMDPKNRREKDLQRIFYKDSTVIISKRPKGADSWDYLAPGTFGEELLDQVQGKSTSIYGSTRSSFGELVKFGRQEAIKNKKN